MLLDSTKHQSRVWVESLACADISPVKRIAPSAIAVSSLFVNFNITLYPAAWAAGGRVAFLYGAGETLTTGCQPGGGGCMAKDCTGAAGAAVAVDSTGTARKLNASHFRTGAYRVCFASAGGTDEFFWQPKATLTVV